MNKVFLLGNLGKDPETKQLPNGGSVTTFPLATQETYVSKGEKTKRTEWHAVVVWGKLGENCGRFLKKGRKAFIEGTIKTRSWEKDGVKRFKTEIVATNVQFLDKPSAEEMERTGDLLNIATVPRENQGEVTHFDDTPNDFNDVPF